MTTLIDLKKRQRRAGELVRREKGRRKSYTPLVLKMSGIGIKRDLHPREVIRMELKGSHMVYCII